MSVVLVTIGKYQSHLEYGLPYLNVFLVFYGSSKQLLE